MALIISIWSDIACPWCFVGKSRLEDALGQLALDAAPPDIELRWRAFELDPRPRAPSTAPYAERLATKYNRSVADAQAMIDTMSDAIRQAGGEADFERIVPANTFDAHRLIQWAGQTDRNGITRNAQTQITDAFMRGYLGHGLDLSSHAAMIGVVEKSGLDADEAQVVLEGAEFADQVRDDERQAQQSGISGVPFFLIDRYGVSGAQDATTLADAIRQVAKALEGR